MQQLSPHLVQERDAIEFEIRAAFDGVTREGGVSWAEADAIDDNGSDLVRAHARAQDSDCAWTELVDDPHWNHELSRWPFLDAVGFKYYIAPAMIRCLRDGGSEPVGYALEVYGEFQRDMIRLLDHRQRRIVARFVRFMIAVHTAADDHICRESWSYAYRVFWKQWDS